jgi:CRP/FNR family transcriptional regulator
LSAFRAGAILFREGQAPADVFLLLHGEVKLSINSVAGRRFILHIAQPGEILGLACALSGHPCEMTAEALHPCYVAKLSFIIPS